VTIRFHHYDALRVFVIAAQHESLTEAADRLSLTKGAVSHQIKRLEEELGFAVFDRHPRGVHLTDKGRELLFTAASAFNEIELSLDVLRGRDTHSLTIGVTTYFASRWLSPRLTSFMRQHPEIRLRIQPMIDFFDFAGEEVDLAIRWGNGKWQDREITKLLDCPAWPTGNREIHKQVMAVGIERAFASNTLLRDRDDSNSWSEWYAVAGLKQPQRIDTLIIQDPSVRVQAVLDGQGIALNDELTREEINAGRLFRLSESELSDYGYFLAYDESILKNPAAAKFMQWVLEE